MPTKDYIVKAIIFPVVMYVWDGRTIKKAECRRIYAVKLWCWRILLRVPWTARSNQSILKEINLELFIKTDNWSWSSNTLATWCKELIHWKKTLMLGKTDGNRRRGSRGWNGQMASLTQWTWVWANSGWQRCLACCCPWSRKESETT